MAEEVVMQEALSFDDINFDVAEPVPASEPEGGKQNEEVPTQEVVEEAPQEAGEETAPGEEPKDGETDGAEKEEAPPEDGAKFIEALDGTKIPEDATLRKKVDGKPVDFTVKQAIDEYTGKLAIQPRFAEANRIKQKAEHLHASTTKQLNEAKALINAFFEHTRNGEHRDAIDALTKFTGSDPSEQWAKFQELQAQNFKRITEMSPEQIREAEIKEENEYYKRQLSRRDEQAREAQERQEIDAKIAESTGKWGIERAAFEDGYKWLLDMKEKGAYSGPIDVATCAEAGFDLRTWAAIDEVVSKDLPEKKGDDAFYREILDDTKKYKLSKDDWMKILTKAKAAKSPASTSNLERKKAKNAVIAPKKDVKKSPASGAPEFWDDI